MKRYAFLLVAVLLFALLLPLTAAVATAAVDPDATPNMYCEGRITPESFPEGYVGSSYSVQLNFVTDDYCGVTLSSSALEYSAEGLPAGLSMSSSGLISGTPTEEGEFPFYIHVTGGEHYHKYEMRSTASGILSAIDHHADGTIVIGPAKEGGDVSGGSGVPTGTDIVGEEPVIAPPQTGESSMSWLWIIAAAGAACTVLAFAMPRKEN